jgi:hypothetical protein
MARSPVQALALLGLEQHIAYLQMGSSYVLAYLEPMLKFHSNSHILINPSNLLDTDSRSVQTRVHRREWKPLSPVS